jgi:hypothetical protein
MNFQYYSLFLSLGIILFSVPVIAQDYLALQGSATGSGGGNGSIVVEIWSAATGGSLLYNSSNDFNNVINNSRYDILLGNGTNPLSLNFSGTYYMEMYINGRDIDFNTSERQVFQSPVGNITVDDPIKTSSSSTYALNVNDRFNVSGATGDTTISGVVNISGATTLSGVTTVANFFNVTPATSAVRTNGTVTVGSTAVIQSTDADDALNVSNGGGNFRGQLGVQNYTSATIPAFTVNYGFNVSGANNALSTNGTVTMGSTAVIQSTDADDALNVSNGGGNFRGQLGVQNYTSATIPAFTVNYGFNVSGANNALSTNGTVTMGSTAVIQSTDADDALNVSNGGGNFRGQLGVQNYTSATIPAFTVNYGFNVSGANSAVRTNGTLTILNSDADDAINTTGGIFIGQGNPGAQFGIGPLTISDVGVITTDTAIGPAAGRGNIVIRSLTAQALSINAGFNVSGPTLAMQTNGTVTIQSRSSPALSIQGFNISGADATLRTNSTVTVITGDQDDAINVSGGGVRIGDSIDFVYVSLVANTPLFSVKNNFNISPAGGVTMGSLGVVKIESTDADDALNVTGSIAQQGAAHTIGNAESTTQHRLEIFDGGTNKCAYIRLFDDLGEDWFLFANSTGQLRMVANAPTGAGQCNTGGGSVGGQPP